jgi:hypothetical protein
VLKIAMRAKPERRTLMSLKMMCGICHAIEDESEDQVFKGKLINTDRQECFVEIRIKALQQLRVYNKDSTDHVCLKCMKQVITNGYK